MSWILKLYETYENCCGKSFDDGIILLPICHATQKANIEVTLDAQSNIVDARAITDKNDTTTIIPCTEDSASRTGNKVPHPLFDKLQYIAGDYLEFGGEHKNYRFDSYIRSLEDWCNSMYGNDKVKVLFTYLKRGSLISDLLKLKLLYCDENNKLLDKWNGSKDDTPEIFKTGTNQIDSFVRFKIIGIDVITKLNEDPVVQNSFISYYLDKNIDKDICYATGKNVMCTEKHQKFLRYAGDGAKLISSNDDSGFTFRGRFERNTEALSVGYEVSQKAHNALKWLISKQGFNEAGEIFLVWGTNGERIPSINTDTDDLVNLFDDGNEVINTEAEFSKRLKRAIKGYGCDFKHNSEIIVICLDAATPGRLSIKYYQEIPGDEFLNRIEYWHSTCRWIHSYKKRNGEHMEFIGAPALLDIVKAAYGVNVNEKLLKSAVERLMPCVLNKASLPADFINSVVSRTSNPLPMENWEWDKMLTVSCALYCKYKEKENYSMGLDENNTNRDYLYGRLLAVADQIENLTFEKWGERSTNAKRYMQTFSLRPFKTWSIIAQNISPYQDKLGPKANYYNDLLSHIHSMFDFNDFKNDSPLSGLYLLGYHSQRQVFINRMRSFMEQNKEKEDIERK